MAEGHRMTTADVLAKVMAGEHGDFVREAVALVARELIEAAISVEVGAGLGEVSAERTAHRNGYRPRPWETRVGEIELLIPRKRSRRPGLSGPQGAVHRRGRRPGARAHGPGHRTPAAGCPEGLPAGGRRRGGPPRVLRIPHDALVKAAVRQSP